MIGCSMKSHIISIRRTMLSARPGFLSAIIVKPLSTAYLKNGGTLERAAQMANHASTRTTQLYDRRRDEMSLDEVEKVMI